MKELLKNRLGRVASPKTVDFIERPVMEPGEGEVLINIKASAICGSDMHIFSGKHPSVSLPVTIGHEFSGDVIVLGKGVSRVKIGDRVTVEPCIVCGKCDACLHGNYGYCEHISFTYRNGDGAMADYITVKENYAYPLPERLSYKAGALIEPMSVAVHAVRRADIRLGEKVLVIGSGAIGILVIALCKLSGAGEILVCDYSASRLAMAKEFGATIAVNPAAGGNLEQAVMDLTGGTGMDKTFECVGRESTFIQAMTSLRRDGLATVIGIFEEPKISINAMRFITHEIRVQGSQGYCWDFPIALKMSERIELEKLVTHEFPLTELQKALETCFDPDSQSIKVILKP
ncbi:MAG: alcohol dehydrogenase catalytic domain-containing protein [Treponema sp.]|jgi:2-desacetyl-2-hydroxyethyl bacteriochlorophyllide A dehydrogenase|nr:alcohol dehydrogenase catalytic domain-containing protein [Treponema sp.]